jgi:hypothetical protein
MWISSQTCQRYDAVGLSEGQGMGDGEGDGCLLGLVEVVVMERWRFLTCSVVSRSDARIHLQHSLFEFSTHFHSFISFFFHPLSSTLFAPHFSPLSLSLVSLSQAVGREAMPLPLTFAVSSFATWSLLANLRDHKQRLVPALYARAQAVRELVAARAGKTGTV